MHRLGALCVRRKWIVVAAWVVVVLAVGAAVYQYGRQTTNDITLPGTGYQASADMLRQEFPPQQNGASPLVFHVESGKLTDPARKKAVEDVLAAIEAMPETYSVFSPFAQGGEVFLSEDEQTAVAQVLLNLDWGQLDKTVATRIMAKAQEVEKAGIQVEAGGGIGVRLAETTDRTSELIGLVAAMIIMAFTFGSLIAAGMPVITAVVGLAVGLGLVGLLGHVVSIPNVAPTLATMVGLGVGIDYALFIVFRHRDQIHRGMPVDESIAAAMATSGSAVVFAGATVIVALLALLVARVPLLGAMGYAAALTVGIAVLTAITLLPAVLAILGRRVDALRIPGRRRASGAPSDKNVWARWAGFVTRHPWAMLIASLLVLAPLIVPVFSLRLGQEDIGAMPTSMSQRRAFDLISEGLGPGANGPLVIAAEFDPPAEPSAEYTARKAEADALKEELEAEGERLEKQGKALERRSDALKKEQRELERLAAQLEAQQAPLEAQGAALAAEAAALQAQKEDLLAEQARLEKEKASLEEQGQELAAEGQALAAEGAALAAQSRQLEAEIAEVQAQLATATDPAEKARLQAQLAVLLRQAQDLQAQAAGLEEQKAALEKEQASLEKQGAALKKEAAALQAEGEELAAQGADLEARSADLTARGEALAAQGESLKKRGAKLEKEGAALKKQADELQRDKKRLERRAKDAEKLKDELVALLTDAGGEPMATDPRVVALQDALAATPGIESVLPPLVNDSGTAVILSATPTTRPADPATAELVDRVRGEVVPAAIEGTAVTAYVGGGTAAFSDLADLISDRLPLVIATVLALSFVLLMIAFRSLLVPLKAVICNLLAVGASFGIITAVFQWGWGLEILGLSNSYGTVPVASYVPLLMFAVLFGLSTDYEVFLISQIFQAHAAGQDPSQAVRTGVGTSARVITAAAVIMVTVFLSFLLHPDPTIKEFGVGLSIAIILDTTIVRLVIVPSTMVLLGTWNWWLPRWLQWLPHAGLDEGAEPAAIPVPADGPAGAGLSGEPAGAATAAEPAAAPTSLT
jgi:uncharacterized membrane protein YdfJ with MMPL/SSD domain